MELNFTLPSETIQGIAEDIYKRVELDIKAIQIDTLCEAGLTFSTRFGTYTGDDTVRIKDVFSILNEMIEELTEGTNET